MPYKCEVCQKSFRYKVSQRTHKCLPKGVENDASSLSEITNNEDAVDQISESFIKAFLESTTATASAPSMHESQNSPLSAEIAAITLCGNSNGSQKSMNDGGENGSAKNALDEVMLSKTIDDIVVESCNKMGIGNSPRMTTNATSPHLSSQYSINSGTTNGSSSPSFKFQNMRLYSPDMMQPHQQHISGETSDFSHFLLGDVGPPLL